MAVTVTSQVPKKCMIDGIGWQILVICQKPDNFNKKRVKFLAVYA